MAMRKDGGYVKAQRMEAIARAIVNLKKNAVNMDRIILWAELNIGLRPETVRYYIERLAAFHGWHIRNGKIIISLEVEKGEEETLEEIPSDEV